MKKPNIIKRALISICSVLFLGCGVASVAMLSSPTPVQAAVETSDTTSLKIIGAQVRTDSPEGLRFITTISNTEKSSYNALDARYGLLVIPYVAMPSGDELTVSVTGSGETLTITPSTHKKGTATTKAGKIETDVWWTADKMTENGITDTSVSVFSSVIAGGNHMSEEELFPAGFYDQPFLARAYVVHKTSASSTDYTVVYSDTLLRSTSYVSFLDGGAAVEGNLVDKAGSVVTSVASDNDVDYLGKNETLAPSLTLGGVPLGENDDVEVEFSGGTGITDNGDKSFTFTAPSGVTDGDQEVTVTFKSKSSLMSDCTTTLTVPVVTTVASYDPGNVAIQASTTASVELPFNSNGRPFTLYGPQGDVILDVATVGGGGTANGVTYNNGTLTFSAEILNKLPTGIRTITAKVKDAERSEIALNLAAYGQLGQNGGLYTPGAGETAGTLLLNDFEGTSATSDVVSTEHSYYLAMQSSQTASLLTGDDAIAGDTSLAFTSTNLTLEAENDLFTFNNEFRANSTFLISLKVRIVDNPFGNGSFMLYIKNKNNANERTGDGLSVNFSRGKDGSYSFEFGEWASNNPFTDWNYDRENDVLILSTILKNPYDPGVLTLTFKNGDSKILSSVNQVKVAVDDISWTQFTTFESVTDALGYDSTFDGGYTQTSSFLTCSANASAITYQNGTELGGKTTGSSLKITTQNAGLTAQWNKVAYGRMTNLLNSWSGLVAGQRYLVHLKVEVTLPPEIKNGKGSLIVYLDERDASVVAPSGVEDTNIYGIIIDLHTDAEGKVTSYEYSNRTDKDTQIFYNQEYSYFSIYTYMTPTRSTQEFALATRTETGGKWELVLDDFAVVKVSNSEFAGGDLADTIKYNPDTYPSTSETRLALTNVTRDNSCVGGWIASQIEGYTHRWQLAPSVQEDNTKGNICWIHLKGQANKTFRVSLTFTVQDSSGNKASGEYINSLIATYNKDGSRGESTDRDVASISSSITTNTDGSVKSWTHTVSDGSLLSSRTLNGKKVYTYTFTFTMDAIAATDTNYVVIRFAEDSLVESATGDLNKRKQTINFTRISVCEQYATTRHWTD